MPPTADPDTYQARPPALKPIPLLTVWSAPLEAEAESLGHSAEACEHLVPVLIVIHLARTRTGGYFTIERPVNTLWGLPTGTSRSPQRDLRDALGINPVFIIVDSISHSLLIAPRERMLHEWNKGRCSLFLTMNLHGQARVLMTRI